MNKQQAQQIIRVTFENSFNKSSFTGFIKNLLNRIDDAPFTYQGNYIPDAYKQYVKTLERIGKFSDGENSIDILVITLQKETSLERARTMQRNFVAWYLNGSRGGEMKDAALAAFVSPDEADWRFSLVKMDYKFEKTKTGRMKVKEEFTPARRWSFLVGANEKSHTAQSRLVNILADDEQTTTLEEIENAFDIEIVTKEFFLKYRDLFLRTKDELDKVVKKNPKVETDFAAKGVDTVNFAKKLLGQIVFLYFLQKKGWFGAGRDSAWGYGSKHFLRELFKKTHGDYHNFFNDILEPLFYEALRIDRSHDDDYYSRFNCKIPFLNGGLFDPIGNYDWVHTDIHLPDRLFSNNNKTKEGDIGDGILDIFDRYNFTVKEDEPLEKDVAIDPELLGKTYEKFNAIRPDNYDEFKSALKSGKTGEENKFNKKFGVYYTPREIVHYMCQQSLINYLHTELNQGIVVYETLGKKQYQMFGNKWKKGQLELTREHQSKPTVSKEDIKILIKLGEQVSENEARVESTGKETITYFYKLPESIRKNAELIDQKLAGIAVCDPAVGSGAFPVGMMSEIVKARTVLTTFVEKKQNRKSYDFKRRCIEHSLYGVDIDPGAIEITKLRLWLSLVVDEYDIANIKQLPNLDYKIVCGNSLLGVKKNLFNNQLFIDLEKLKPLYFNETNTTNKLSYKKQIDTLIGLITNGHKEFDFDVYFSEVFHEKGGFDVVIANPPYVQFQKLDLKTRNLLRKHRFYESQSDLWYFFIYRAHELLHEKSQIIFIVSNYFLQAGHADTLRSFITNHTKVLSIINFTDQHVFENVGVHNAILYLEKQSSEDYTFPYIKCGELCKLSTEYNETYIISREALGKTWRLVHDNDANLLNKLLSKGQNLGTFSKISNGIKSGDDTVFVINNSDKKCLIEKELLRDYLKNSEIHKYYIDKPIKKIIYTTSNTLINNYPLFKKYILQHKKRLENKWNNRGEINEYWKLYRAREDLYNSGKELIITPYRTSNFGFAFNKDCLSGTDTYLILNTSSQKISDNTLLGLLNSTLLFWIYKKIGKRKGKIFEIASRELSLLPIVFPANKNVQFNNLVEKILAITKTDDYLKSHAKKDQVKEYEKQIDQLVYKLYDLTPEEIKLVECENTNAY